jgi:hypothetical protein
MNRWGIRRVATVLVALLALSVTAAAATAAKRNPETDKSLGPADGPGYFLGSPQATYSWHGCTKSDTQYWPVSLVDGTPTTNKGSSRYVRFAVSRTSLPRFSWRTKPGYRICGVQAAVQLSSPQVDSDLLAEASYPSGPTAGTTIAVGREQLKVTIPTKGIRVRGFEKFEGRSFSILAFQSVTVFVKKKP